MITFREIEELMSNHRKPIPIVSLYLGTDGENYTKRDAEIVVKDLIKEKEKALETLEYDKSNKSSLLSDFEKIRLFIKNEFNWKGKKGLALFSSSADNFWKIYPLPRSVKNILVVDRTPHIRPLIALFDEHRRFCAVLVDKMRARIFEMFLGEIEEHTEMIAEIPRKAKAGGWKGNEERRIERHLSEEVHKHFKRVGESLMDFFKLYHFDDLIIAGHRDEFSTFENELHPYLKARVVARLEMDMHVSEGAVSEKILAVERTVRKDHADKLVVQLQELLGERMAVTGILGTLTAHRKGQIRSLIVNREYQVPGTRCSQCGYLDQGGKECPKCKKLLVAIPDLVDDLIESAVTQGCKVEYVWDGQKINQLGGIGAILRFKM